VQTRAVEFYSDGVRMDGLLWLPDEVPARGRRATVLLCSGYQGLKEWVPARLRPPFLSAGYACFAFDYRGFGTSDGERGRLRPLELVDDILDAVTFVQQQPEVDPERMGLVGWGMGGGLVVQAAAADSRVRAVAALNGLGDAGRVVRDGVTYPAWVALQDRIAEDRVQRVLTGRSTRVPWREIILPAVPIGKEDRQFNADVRDVGKPIVEEMTLASAEAYCAFKPERVVDRISPRPLLIVHGARNEYHPLDEARHLYARAGEPKQLIEIAGAGHLDWIHPQSPLRDPNLARVVDWFSAALPVRAD